MEIKLKMNKTKSLIKLFEFYNFIQPVQANLLTVSEMELLSVFCTLPEKYRHSMFSIHGKRKVIQEYKSLFGKTLSNVNLNNKVYGLLDKGFLFRDEDKVIYLKPFLRKALDDVAKNNRIEFNVLIDVYEDDELSGSNEASSKGSRI